MTEYLSCADTARLIRAALARSFPGTKFSVRSSVYTGGASIRVRYDGITGYAPVVCHCPAGMTIDPSGGVECGTCGYRGRVTPIYRPGAPTRGAVYAVVGPFSASGFDGMSDLKYPITAYVDASGAIVGSRSPGAYGSVRAWDDEPDGARAVDFGADFIFVEATL